MAQCAYAELRGRYADAVHKSLEETTGAQHLVSLGSLSLSQSYTGNHDDAQSEEKTQSLSFSSERGNSPGQYDREKSLTASENVQFLKQELEQAAQGARVLSARIAQERSAGRNRHRQLLDEVSEILEAASAKVIHTSKDQERRNPLAELGSHVGLSSVGQLTASQQYDRYVSSSESNPLCAHISTSDSVLCSSLEGTGSASIYDNTGGRRTGNTGTAGGYAAYLNSITSNESEGEEATRTVDDMLLHLRASAPGSHKKQHVKKKGWAGKKTHKFNTAGNTGRTRSTSKSPVRVSTSSSLENKQLMRRSISPDRRGSRSPQRSDHGDDNHKYNKLHAMHEVSMCTCVCMDAIFLPILATNF